MESIELYKTSRGWKLFVWMIIAIALVGLVLGFCEPAQAQTPDSLYLPQVGKAEEDLTVQTEAETISVPIFCRIVGRNTIWGGEIICDILYIMISQVVRSFPSPPLPTPTPTPMPTPTATPLPEGMYTIISSGSDVEEPRETCRLINLLMYCNIEVRFEAVTTESCPNLYKIEVSYQDGTRQFSRIEGTTILRNGELWVDLFPPRYEVSNGSKGMYYTVNALCKH